MGDAVWEGQMPAALQTLFDASSGKQVFLNNDYHSIINDYHSIKYYQ